MTLGQLSMDEAGFGPVFDFLISSSERIVVSCWKGEHVSFVMGNLARWERSRPNTYLVVNVPLGAPFSSNLPLLPKSRLVSFLQKRGRIHTPRRHPRMAPELKST